MAPGIPPSPTLAYLSEVGDSVYNCFGSTAKMLPMPVLSDSMNPVVRSTCGGFSALTMKDDDLCVTYCE